MQRRFIINLKFSEFFRPQVAVSYLHFHMCATPQIGPGRDSDWQAAGAFATQDMIQCLQAEELFVSAMHLRDQTVPSSSPTIAPLIRSRCSMCYTANMGLLFVTYRPITQTRRNLWTYQLLALPRESSLAPIAWRRPPFNRYLLRKWRVRSRRRPLFSTLSPPCGWRGSTRGLLTESRHAGPLQGACDV
jgi:hypothetical protein